MQRDGQSVPMPENTRNFQNFQPKIHNSNENESEVLRFGALWVGFAQTQGRGGGAAWERTDQPPTMWSMSS
jgi:hypothetical protein